MWHWFSTTCLENSWSGLGVHPVNITFYLIYFLQFMWWWCGFPKWANIQKIICISFFQEWGRGRAQSEKGHLCRSRHRWQVCGKGWARGSGCAPHHPVLLRRTWDVRGKRGWRCLGRGPSLPCWVPAACCVSLGNVNEDGGVISWFPAAENKCLVKNMWQRLLLGAMDWWCQGGQLWTKPPTSNLYNSIDT